MLRTLANDQCVLSTAECQPIDVAFLKMSLLLCYVCMHIIYNSYQGEPDPVLFGNMKGNKITINENER